MNRLFYGDNLAVLRASIATETVDLVYLDPPFNSNANYNLLFKAPSGEGSQAQIEAFEDTWHWDEAAERACYEVRRSGHSDVAIMLEAMRSALGENDMMAYLAMMAIRLIELHRVLKPKGSLYLHCDPTASHYLKILLDAVFGPEKFVNQITWKRSHAHSDAKQGSRHYGRVSDVLLFYSKSEERTWNVQYTPYSQEYIDRDYRRVNPDGRRYRLDNIQGPGGAEKGNPYYEVMGVSRYWRYSKTKMDELIAKGLIVQTSPGAVPQIKRYLDEMPGVPAQDIWTDIPIINNRSKEVLGYPTQKPVALLERIIATSSNEGDIVLDPFCGCGTSIHAAQKRKREWVGIDITHLAIALVERRLTEAFSGIEYKVNGVPTDLAGARDLAERDKHQFQMWIAAKVGAQPYKDGKKGMDRGIDGYLFFRDEDNRPQRAIVSVKGGERITSAMVRDLKGTMEREKAALGLFLTLTPPTREMTKEAASAGFYETGGRSFPRLQILTAEDIIGGKMPQVPFGFSEGFRRAAPEKSEEQGKLF